MKALRRLATYAAELRFEDLPEAVVARAREVVRDTLGVIAGGMQEPSVQRLADYAVRLRPGTATLIGHGGRVDPAWAALVHGSAGTSLELDEGHAYARGHAAIHALPPALALAETSGASGERALAAFVAGYEVAARVGVATRLRSVVHPFGTWGVLGAATVAAHLRGLDGDALLETLELAASYAITPSFDSARQGAEVRNTYAGMVNRNGLLAFDMWTLGLRGERGGVGTTFGRILGEAFDPAALEDDLGERFEIERGYFKPYSGCRYTHGAVEAALALRQRLGVRQLRRIERVDVASYALAATLDEPRPGNALAARFSLPYVTAATLLLGHADRDAFAPEALADPELLELAARVTVREEPAFTALTPAQRPTRVTLHLDDGSTVEHTVYGSSGDPDRPMAAAALRRKFEGLLAPRFPPERRAALWLAAGRLDTLPGVAELLRAFAGDAASEVPMR